MIIINWKNYVLIYIFYSSYQWIVQQLILIEKNNNNNYNILKTFCTGELKT